MGAAVDHGPQASSIAIARMAATCGVGINSAMASAINALGDVHGGAGEQAQSFYGDIAKAIDGGAAFGRRSRHGSTGSSSRKGVMCRGSATAFTRSIRAHRACRN
nr:citrate/2-methylcitrate synthase [Mesorhizobium sp. WSM4312]